ncbi:MAG: sulfite exporter TauE/SafE family protein [Ruminococcaceae bacterium]|nr:sulfite exporter TauE/SafE family protein [Oscillospiraceae bacterium]
MNVSPDLPSSDPPPRQRGGGFGYAAAGAIAGAVNGLFGGGGGMPLLFLLRRSGLEDKTAFATCVAVILPLCAVSALVYLLRGALPLREALPYLAGGLSGGWLGGRLFRRVPDVWLRRAFALFLLYGAYRYLI